MTAPDSNNFDKAIFKFSCSVKVKLLFSGMYFCETRFSNGITKPWTYCKTTWSSVSVSHLSKKYFNLPAWGITSVRVCAFWRLSSLPMSCDLWLVEALVSFGRCSGGSSAHSVCTPAVLVCEVGLSSFPEKRICE